MHGEGGGGGREGITEEVGQGTQVEKQGRVDKESLSWGEEELDGAKVGGIAWNMKTAGVAVVGKHLNLKTQHRYYIFPLFLSDRNVTHVNTNMTSCYIHGQTSVKVYNHRYI